MAVNKVELYVSQILEDLNNGLTWLKKDDLGYGSIQEKYNAKDVQIMTIRKHPALKDAETSVTVFTIIDDTKEQTNAGTITSGVNNSSDALNMGSLPKIEQGFNNGEQRETSLPTDSDTNVTARTAEVYATTDSELSAFASL